RNAVRLKLRCGRTTASRKSLAPAGGGAAMRSQPGDIDAQRARSERAAKGQAPQRGSRLPKRLTRAQAEELFKRLSKDRPDPRTELAYSNPYTLLVSAALSGRA